VFQNAKRRIFKPLPAIRRMKKQHYITIIILLLFVGCKTEKKEKENKLLGEWSRIERKKSDDFPPPPFYRPFGFGFSKNKIEFFNGFTRVERDSLTGKRSFNYKGNFTDYKIMNDSIFILDPFEKKWIYKWKIESLKNDTLIVSKNDSVFTKFKKIKYDFDLTLNFDQIIYSRSGCYGTCPIIDISINRKNEIYFQGEGYVEPLGFFKTKVDSTLTNYIFDKFRKANINKLSDNYAVGHTDDESITTTFIKNGKIIKTIHDYGKDGPKELIWAYVPIENLYSTLKLDSLPNDEPFYPKLHYYTFSKDSLILRLQKSESFFFWTELQKSQIIDKNFKFKVKYEVWFRGNYTYWGPDPNKKRKHKYEIEKIDSDGRFFKFYFKGEKPIIYDLGYDFIKRNFDENNFKKRMKYD
jgi:hypothetical protein